ncbi:hypothetical protein [Roseivivax sp. CAU 1753]
MRLLSFAMIALLTAGAAVAEPLAEMDGAWRGSGWARQTPDGPQETVRCRIRNVYVAADDTLQLSGDCVVPGRRFAISGSLVGTGGSERITGRWSNPDGVGSVRISGVRRDGIVAFTFNATDPVTGRDVSQNVEWRISTGGLRLRSTDRGNPDIMMSDIAFTE